jgi:hypothetical protein
VIALALPSVSFVMSLVKFHFHTTLATRAYVHLEIVLFATSTHATTLI